MFLLRDTNSNEEYELTEKEYKNLIQFLQSDRANELEKKYI